MESTSQAEDGGEDEDYCGRQQPFCDSSAPRDILYTIKDLQSSRYTNRSFHLRDRMPSDFGSGSRAGGWA